MKKCPFCAEEIQVEAIKCRYCHSFVDGRPDGAAAAAAAVQAPAPAPEKATTPVRERESAADRRDRRWLYQGPRSWRALFAHYLLFVLATAAVPVATGWAAHAFGASVGAQVVAVALPLVGGLIALLGLHVYRKSIVYWISTTTIERQSGVMSKNIEVVELRRCRDLEYRQSLGERLLGIANIEVIGDGPEGARMVLEGVVLSRPQFEKIRDHVERQRRR